jgi:hypothetical protein
MASAEESTPSSLPLLGSFLPSMKSRISSPKFLHPSRLRAPEASLRNRRSLTKVWGWSGELLMRYDKAELEAFCILLGSSVNMNVKRRSTSWYWTSNIAELLKWVRGSLAGHCGGFITCGGGMMTWFSWAMRHREGGFRLAAITNRCLNAHKAFFSLSS